MILAIVGSEAAKFTPQTESSARLIIRDLIERTQPTTVVSGACHLGGIDSWAIEEAQQLGVATEEFPPRERNWSNGYRLRNIQIAQAADMVVCITVRVLPPGFGDAHRYEVCYHCPAGLNDHVKSGGCWTVRFAMDRLGKQGAVIVIENGIRGEAASR